MSNFNDFLGAQAAKLNMTREEYTSYYLSEAKPGPKPYHRGLDDNEIEDKKDQIKKQSDMDDDDSDAYKEMPGDKEARKKGEVKTSKHVKKYHELYGDKKDESVDEATFRPNSGTMSGGTYNLDNRKYELKKDVEGVQIGNYTNIVLPKGTIIYNIPGGVFADHSSLKRYENRSNKYFNKSTFKGISIIRKKETIFSIDKNSKILESFESFKNEKLDKSFDIDSAIVANEGLSKSAIKKMVKVIDKQIDTETGGDGEPLDNETLQALEQERERLLAMNEGKTISSSKISMMGAKILNKINIGTIFDTEDGEYEITDYGRQANAFKEFEAEHNGKKVKVKLTAMYGVTLEVTDDVRSARFNKEVRLNSIILESANEATSVESVVNEFYFENDEEERLQKFVDQLSFGDELEYRDGFSTGRGSFPNTRELKKELDSNFQLLLTQKSGRNWDLYVGSDDLVFLIQPDLGAKNYIQISISSTKEQWNDESNVFARSNGYLVYESVVTEAKEEPIVALLKLGLFASKGTGEKELLRLSDDFEEIGDEQADEIASHLNMAIELFQDGYSKAAVPHFKKFNKACKDELALMKKQGLAESEVNEEKIKYAKGKTYQSSGHWTVVVDSNSSGLDIRVNHSAGWRLDPHDEKEETFELLDNGRQRATLYFKSGNIDKFAKQMFDLNDRTTHGNATKLTAKDYADIIRVWIDMRKANEGNYNLEDIYDLISHHRFNKDYEKLSSKDKEWIQNDAEERGFVESLSPRFFNSLLKTLNEDLITESRVPNFKFGKKLQYNTDDINQMYGFWGTLDVHMDSYEIEEIWNDVWGILTKGWKFSDAGALYYLNAKAGRWLADKVWNDINSQISQPDAIDMILSDYARPSKWKAWAKEYNEFAQEELAECVILEKAEGDRGPINDPKIEKALKTKSEETGVPIGIIRIIMRRGMAAWKTGHRPGATEQQWGYARVNAFLTKGKGTWGDADKDVAKEVRDEGHDKELKEQNHFDQSHRNNNI